MNLSPLFEKVLSRATVWYLLPLILLGTGVQDFWHFSGELWAAWIQAVGSVVAILVAVYAPMWQEEYRRRERLVGVLNGLCKLTKNISKMARVLGRRLDREGDLDWHRRAMSKNHLKPLLSALEKVDISDVIASDSVGPFLNLQSYALRLSELWDEASMLGDSLPDRYASRVFCRRTGVKLDEIDSIFARQIVKIEKGAITFASRTVRERGSKGRS